MKLTNKSAKAFIDLYSILVFLFIFLWSYKTPLVTDDLFFSHNKILGPSINDYFESNGRIFGQSFTRFILSKNIFFSSICTGIAFMLLMLILFKITNTYTKDSVYIVRLLLITISIFLFVPGFASVFIWRAGVGNYLITAVIELLFIMIIYNDDKNSLLYSILVIPLGFIAGLGNENTSGGILLICILFLVRPYLKHEKLPLKIILGTVSLLVGYCVLMMSPGSKKRAEANDYAYLHQNLVKRLIEGIERQASFLKMEYWPIVFLAFVITIVVLAFIFWKNNTLFYDGIVFIIGGLASGLVLIMSPEGMDIGRPYLGPMLLMLIGTMLLIPLQINDRYVKVFYISGTLILALICSVNLITGIQNSSDFNNQLSARYSYIAHSKSKVVKVKAIKKENNYNKYSLSPIYWEVGKDPSAFPNNQYYEYFHKKVILDK